MVNESQGKVHINRLESKNTEPTRRRPLNAKAPVHCYRKVAGHARNVPSESNASSVDPLRRGGISSSRLGGPHAQHRHDLRLLPLALLLAALAFQETRAATPPRQPVNGRGRRELVEWPPASESSVPYKTFYVTRACEWKSSLFVPKSNDIHFAQSWPLVSDGAEPAESSVVYETLANGEQPPRTARGQLQDQSRTLLSTDSKALIVALPITMGYSFAGYEPACSIRLIVPRNMRILAKLTSRRLAFAQQQLEGQSEGQRILWLNVSQNQFIETEHRTLESDSNVLAFRFLFERFAHKQAPDTRFQVILTAFQTLGENGDLNGGLYGLQASVEPNSQFICDQQRLISANLACDGFKNCQDGHDEERTTCLAIRNSQLDLPTVHAARPLLETNRTSLAAGQAESRPLWLFGRDLSPLLGLLAGLLLLLACACCCAFSAYHAYLLWLRHWPALGLRPERRQAAAEVGALARQNRENAKRLKLSQTLDTTTSSSSTLQSILKKTEPLLGPLESVVHGSSPPRVPARQARSPLVVPPIRGALSTSLVQGGHRLPSGHFKPTPARRVSRDPTLRSPLHPAGLSFGFDLASDGVSPNPSAHPPVPTSKTSHTSTGTQRITTYHYSSGSTRMSESYLRKLAAQQQQQQQQRQQPSPPAGS